MNLKLSAQRLVRRMLVPGISRLGSAEVFACLQDHVAPALGLPPAGEFERVPTGANTTVIRWTTRREGVLYARIWRWKRQNCPVHQHLEAVSLFDRAGLRTPEVLFADESTATLLQWGVEILVEREAEGPSLKHAGEAQQEGFRRLARDLSRLHSIEGSVWHKPWQRKQGFSDPMRLWSERLERFSERITPETSGLRETEIGAGLKLTKEGLARVAGLKPVAIHGDVSQSHVHLDAEGRLVWIDMETVRFSRPEEDLAAVARTLKERYFPSFFKHYAEFAGRPVDIEALRTFSLLLHWERLNSRVQQRRRLHSKIADTREDQGKKRHSKLHKDQRNSEDAIRVLIGENPFLSLTGGSQPPGIPG